MWMTFQICPQYVQCLILLHNGCQDIFLWTQTSTRDWQVSLISFSLHHYNVHSSSWRSIPIPFSQSSPIMSVWRLSVWICRLGKNTIFRFSRKIFPSTRREFHFSHWFIKTRTRSLNEWIVGIFPSKMFLMHFHEFDWRRSLSCWNEIENYSTIFHWQQFYLFLYDLLEFEFNFHRNETLAQQLQPKWSYFSTEHIFTAKLCWIPW